MRAGELSHGCLDSVEMMAEDQRKLGTECAILESFVHGGPSSEKGKAQ